MIFEQSLSFGQNLSFGQICDFWAHGTLLNLLTIGHMVLYLEGTWINTEGAWTLKGFLGSSSGSMTTTSQLESSSWYSLQLEGHHHK